MSMVIKNNMNAIHTLSTLNNNSSALQKSLQHVATGMKIVTAQDDASAYAISERMRVQLRSLDQAKQNTQTDLSMMKVAEGAVGSTLELIKTMKEKAINAANDSNTDEDRKTIQKEIDHFIDQVDDNALLTFNGKHLLLGDSSSLYLGDISDEDAVIRGLSSAWIGDALSLIEESFGISFEQNGNKYHSMDVKFVGGHTGITAGSNADYPAGFASATAWCGGSPTNPNHLQLTVNLDIVQNMDVRSPDGLFAGGGPSQNDNANGMLADDDDDQNNNTSGGGQLDRVIAHELMHGIMTSMVDKMNDLSAWIVEGGTAELLHGADERSDLASYVTSAEAMDAVFTAGGGSDDGNGYTANTVVTNAYGGGFVAMRYFAKQSIHTNDNEQGVMKKFMQALVGGSDADGAFSFASGGKYKSQQAFQESMKADITSYINSGGTAEGFLKDKCGINLNNDDTGSLTGLDAGNRVEKNAFNVLPQASSPVNWSLPSSKMTVIKGLQVYWPEHHNAGTAGGSLNFHTGASANQAIHVGLFDMRAKAIGLIDQDGNKLDVSTIGKANQAVGLLDKILNVVLDEATNIGAIEARLVYTGDNLTTSSENVQNSESTIRDADMAKEMTNYTKNNVLLQASQSMLAQANQNSSNVLSLLQ